MGKRWVERGRRKGNTGPKEGMPRINASRREPLGLKGSMNFHFSVLVVWAFGGGEHGRLGRRTAFFFLL